MRAGDRMQTATGGQFWPMDPLAHEVDPRDIAHALALQCRFGGHCTRFYSVAEHSVHVSRAVPERDGLWGLLHDASEAYCADVPRPLKRFLTGYEEIERNVMTAVCERFGLTPDMPDTVARADNAILADEAYQIMLAPPADWHLPEPPLGIDLQCWSPDVAREQFMSRLDELLSSKTT